MVVPTVLACALCCLGLACPPLLWARQGALPFALLESYRSKPSSFSEMRASSCPAGRLAPGGRTVGGVRRASLLLLVPWLAVCTCTHPDYVLAVCPCADTICTWANGICNHNICSNEPMVCDGTYSGTQMCALPPPTPCLPRRTLNRREGASTWGWDELSTWPPLMGPHPCVDTTSQP